MTTTKGIVSAVLLSLCIAPFAAAKVYVRWTYQQLPPVKTLGVSDLVLSSGDDAKSLVEAAIKRGYHVYLETTADKAPATAELSFKVGAVGIIIEAEVAKQAEAETAAQRLKTEYPKLKILVLDSGGHQPDMRGWLVFNKNGVLQVSSPTSQPWLDSNLPLVRYEEAFQKTQAPLYSFAWDTTDALVKQQGPRPEDYELAIAEAGALHADLILDIHERQQKGLAEGDKATLSDWELVKRALAFYEQGGASSAQAAAAVAVLTDDYDSCYEPLNLMGRHNIPYRVLRSSQATAQDLAGLDVVIAFAEPSRELTQVLFRLAQSGGVAVLVNLKGPFPWQSDPAPAASGPSVTFTVGKGRVIELREPIIDPETFARDVRRLMRKEQVPVSLWNSLTTLVVSYPGKASGGVTVELVNYAEESTQVQVQVKGRFRAVRYQTTEHAKWESLKPSVVDGFTEFVVPDILIGGRVELSGAEASVQ